MSTKTEKNLMDAFAGESQARNKYTYFASVAKKEGAINFLFYKGIVCFEFFIISAGGKRNYQ